MDRDEALAELRRVKRQRERADAVRTAAAIATREAIVHALEARISPTEIAEACGVTDSHVRAVRREAGLPANPAYANLKPPVRTKAKVETEPVRREPEPWAEPSPSMRPLSVPSEDDLPADVRAIHPGLAADIVDKIRRGFPTWHDEARAAIAAAPPLFQNLLEIKRAKDAGVLDDLGIELP